ncbi:MAG: 30S ribosomal protein S17 [Patescibacteria group bacterium]
MNKQIVQKFLTGTIVSDKMTNTAVIEVEVWKIHRIIKKRYKRHSRFMAENPDNQYKTGDLVRIQESKPLSRHKRWVIVGIANKKDAS